MIQEGVFMTGKIFTNAEEEALNKRFQGDKSDPTGIFRVVVK